MIHFGRQWLLLLGGLLLLVGGLLMWFLWPRPSAAEQLAAARAQWAARPFTHYRMAVEQQGLVLCRFESEIQDEHVLTVTQNTCNEPPLTVSGFFDHITQSLAMRCATPNCSCDLQFLVVNVQYDAQFGYPQEIAAHWEQNPWYPVKQWWERHFSTAASGCVYSRSGVVGGTIRVRSLTPLP